MMGVLEMPRGKISGRHRAKIAKDPGAFEPYRPLDPARLKLTGEGRWPLATFLDDELWLPYLEPGVLRHGLSVAGSGIPNFKLETKERNLELALFWSTKSLLSLFPDLPLVALLVVCSIASKNESQDRLETGEWLTCRNAPLKVRPNIFEEVIFLPRSLCPMAVLFMGQAQTERTFTIKLC